MKKANYWVVFLILFFNGVFAGSQKDYDGSYPFIWQVTRMDINNISIPLRNDGAIFESVGHPGYYPSGQTTLGFLFSGGFGICGYFNGGLRASWIATASLLEEWRPGKWGMDPNNPLARFYEVRSNDGFGSAAYADWANAVALGADFIDLNGDGIYDPNVDKPPVIGNRIIWTVFNDSTFYTYPGGLGAPPMGLEIQQMVWAFARTDILGDIIFFWHRLINTGGNQIDSLIFSVWEDADIGDYMDDLVGCDTTLNLGYCYNDADDVNYGSNPPAFGVMILQGPVADSPGDTAFVYRGPSTGIDTLFNKTTHSMTSFMYYIQGGAILSNPQNAQTARYYQEGGKDMQGNPIDPTQWGNGGSPTTNSKFFYSGNPVASTGWLDNAPADKLFLVNTGPFDIAAGDTQDIVFAYIVRQGSDALNSVQVMKEGAGFLDSFFPDSTIIVSINEGDPVHGIAGSFQLFQNYPNPFNPVTIIPVSIPEKTEAELVVYNILGERIRTPYSGVLEPGRHGFAWQGQNQNDQRVASGIYVYQFISDQYRKSGKMILMK